MRRGRERSRHTPRSRELPPSPARPVVRRLKKKMQGLGFDEEALSWEDSFRACKKTGFKEKELTRCLAAPGDKEDRDDARQFAFKKNLYEMFPGLAPDDDGKANLIAV